LRRGGKISTGGLGRGDFAVPISARWDRGVLMNQFPLAVSPLEAISFAHHKLFRIAFSTTLTLWIVQTIAMSPFTTTSVSRMSTLQDWKLPNTRSKNFNAG
jgi:hypothetical protein